jgi:hypothetical protein
LDRRGFPRDPEPRVASRQELYASTQDGPWRGEADTSPALAGAATAAEGEDGQNAEAGWPIWVGGELRSFLGIAALLVFALPAVVLVLTLLGEDNKPVSMKTPTARGNAITQQDRTEGGDRSGNRDGSDRLLRRHDASPVTSSEGDGAAPTRQTGRDQRGSNKVQDTSAAAVPATPTSAAAGSPEPSSSVAASATPTSTVAASSAPATRTVEGSGEAPTASTPSVPPDASTGPITQPPSSAPAESAPPIAQQPSLLDPSASAIARGMPAPGEAPAGDFQSVVPDINSYDPSEYYGRSPR